jgi:hypothetical protein
MGRSPISRKHSGQMKVAEGLEDSGAVRRRPLPASELNKRRTPTLPQPLVCGSFGVRPLAFGETRSTENHMRRRIASAIRRGGREATTSEMRRRAELGGQVAKQRRRRAPAPARGARKGPRRRPLPASELKTEQGASATELLTSSLFLLPCLIRLFDQSKISGEGLTVARKL